MNLIRSQFLHYFLDIRFEFGKGTAHRVSQLQYLEPASVLILIRSHFRLLIRCETLSLKCTLNILAEMLSQVISEHSEP